MEILISLTACLIVPIWLISTFPWYSWYSNYFICSRITASLRLVVVLINLVIFCCNRSTDFQSSLFCRFFKSSHTQRLFTIPVIAMGFMGDLVLTPYPSSSLFMFTLVAIGIYQYRLPNSLLSWIMLFLCALVGIAAAFIAKPSNQCVIHSYDIWLSMYNNCTGYFDGPSF